MIRKLLLHLFPWLFLAVVLLLLVPMAYPVELPLEYHFYHFILFCLLIAVYYFNVNYLLPVIKKKHGLFYYVLSIVLIAFGSVFLMELVSETLNIRELIHQKLNPGEPYVKKTNVFIFFYIIILVSIIVGTGIILQLVKKWNREEKNNIILREEKSKAELTTLKAQIHPHFFFNTLNTIYSLSHSDVPQSQEALLKLSKMMRFAMNEENLEMVPLQQELEFVRNYLDLMKHRLPDSITLIAHLSEAKDELEIVPMVLLTFIENCFKHGITTEKECEIKIETFLNGHTFILKTENNIVSNQPNALQSTGIGIENTIKRLDILYPENYSYEHRTEEGKYYCELKINLK